MIFPNGMGIFFTPRGSMIKLSSLRSILAPMMVMISIRLATSDISGTPSRVTISSARMVAGIRATTLFFAPLMVTSPFRGRPPFITIFFILIIISSFKSFSFYYRFFNGNKRDNVFKILQLLYHRSTYFSICRNFQNEKKLGSS